MEGGIAVAPASLGRYGGDLVAPGETSGRVFAVGPDGSVVTLVVPACRTAATSASRAPASCRSDSALATPRISLTGSPRLRAFTGRGNRALRDSMAWVRNAAPKLMTEAK
jgi:hypothetical protein